MLEYRNRFLEKWILRNPWIESDQYFFMDYDHLLAHPQETLCEIIRFALPEEIVDHQRIEKALTRRPVKPKTKPPGFQICLDLEQA